MECFLDFCLACDKQTTDGFYCSQACRLADMEKAGASAPTSPCSIEQDSWQSSRPTRASAFALAPGFDFSISKSGSKDRNPQISPSDKERVLSPSASRSSLASAASGFSTQNSQAMSEQAQHELNDYVSSFDAIREMKRRSLSNNTSH